MEEKNMPLYDKILLLGKEALKGINDIVARRSDKRAFESAYDSAEDKKDKAQRKLTEYYEKVGKYSDNMEEMVKCGNEILCAEKTQTFLKSEYKKLFRKEFQPKED